MAYQHAMFDVHAAIDHGLGVLGRRTVTLGAADHQAGTVRSLHVRTDADGALMVDARVSAGGRAMQAMKTVAIDLGTDGAVLICSCAEGGGCRHVAATLFALAERLEVMPRNTPPIDALADDGLPLDRVQHAWLDRLTGAAHAEAAPAPEVTIEHVLRVEPRDDGSPARVWVEVSSGRRARVVVPYARLEAAARGHTHPVDLALARDLGWADGDGGAPLIGSRGARTLALLLASGRLVLDGAGGTRRRVLRGGERGARLGFALGADAVQWPTIVLEDEPAAEGPDGAEGAEGAEGAAGAPRVLATTPPMYLDPRGPTIGELRVANATEALVGEWRLGERFSAAQVPALREALGARGLPVPKAVRRRHVPARAVLRLESGALRSPVNGATTDPVPWVRALLEVDGVVHERSSLPTRVIETADAIEIVEPDPRVKEALEALLRQSPLRSARGVYANGSVEEGLFALPRVPPAAFERKVRAAFAGADVSVELADDYSYLTTEVELRLGLEEPSETSDLADVFEVSLGITIDGQTIDVLPLVLAALRADPSALSEGIHFAHEGRWLYVPSERLAPIHTLLVELMEPAARGGRTISRVRALGIDPALLPRSPASLERLREALRTPAKAPIPRGLRAATLREYQIVGYQWLEARRRAGLGAVLADDMGLGKTIQTIALLLRERAARRAGAGAGTTRAADRNPSLVVCPKSVAPNWADELARFAPSLRVYEHHGRDRETADELPECDVVLTTYPTLLRDEELFTRARFSTVVADEAQAFKNAASGLAAAVCALRADFRLALTGTPMENHLGELWSVMRFALPELLPDSRTFARLYRRPIEREGHEEARRQLRARLAPFMLRRLKGEVASELPEKTVVVERVELTESQRETYETVRVTMSARVQLALEQKGLARSQIVVLDALLKLRQAVCDPRLLKVASARRAGSAKLDALVEKVALLAAEGRRVLVFSQFVAMLELIAEALRAADLAYVMLTGQTDDRRAVVNEFREGIAPVFLLSLKAGGAGLNLTEADVVIHYDPWWNPAAEAQATDRAHRIGQVKPVFVYKLIGRGTIEEKILALQEKKRALFASILDDGAGVAKALTEEDVRFLFS